MTTVELSTIEAGTGGFVINGVSVADFSGYSVSGAGDVNGDGLAVLIVGAKQDDPNGGDSGASFVMFGNTSTAVVELSDIVAGTGGFVINGVAAGDESGSTVSGGGDVNGDGLSDLIVGVRLDDPNGGASGASFVVSGKATTTTVQLSDVEAGTGGFVINGVSGVDYAGNSVSDAGVVNGDGRADLIIGANSDDPNGTDSGASFVVFGKATTTTVELSDVEAGTGGFVINGAAAGDASGRSVSGAGDVNGDGIANLVVGARNADPNGVDSGAAFVVFGKATTTTVQLSDIQAGTGGFVVNGVSAGDEFGTSVSGAGDFNDDGLADLVVGARRDDPNGSGSGTAFVVYGKSTTMTVELSDVEAGTGGFDINGVSASDYAGQSVSGAGDVNGDGTDDVIVGAYFDDPNGTASGASFVIFGTPAPVTATPTSTDLPLTNVVTVADGTTSFSFVNSTGSTARGVLINNTGNGNFVAANLPDRVTLANAGTDTAEFMAGKAAGTLFDIRTLTPTVSGVQSLSENIVLTGSTSGAGEDAFVIDTRDLPTGSVIQLDNVEFAAIVGAVTVTGARAKTMRSATVRRRISASARWMTRCSVVGATIRSEARSARISSTVIRAPIRCAVVGAWTRSMAVRATILSTAPMMATVCSATLAPTSSMAVRARMSSMAIRRWTRSLARLASIPCSAAKATTSSMVIPGRTSFMAISAPMLCMAARTRTRSTAGRERTASSAVWGPTASLSRSAGRPTRHSIFRCFRVIACKSISPARRSPR